MLQYFCYVNSLYIGIEDNINKEILCLLSALYYYAKIEILHASLKTFNYEIHTVSGLYGGRCCRWA